MHAEKEDQAEDQEGHCWLLGRPVPVARMFRRAPCSRGSSRLAEESLISSSWISSHWASVRWLSGIARSSCKRARGDIGCGACMAVLSHRWTRARELTIDGALVGPAGEGLERVTCGGRGRRVAITIALDAEALPWPALACRRSTT